MFFQAGKEYPLWSLEKPTKNCTAIINCLAATCGPFCLVSAGAQYANKMQIACKQYANNMNILCKQYANSMQIICIYYANSMQIVCRQYADSMQIVCTQYANSMQQYANSMHIVCNSMQIVYKQFAILLGIEIIMVYSNYRLLEYGVQQYKGVSNNIFFPPKPFFSQNQLVFYQFPMVFLCIHWLPWPPLQGYTNQKKQLIIALKNRGGYCYHSYIAQKHMVSNKYQKVSI